MRRFISWIAVLSMALAVITSPTFASAAASHAIAQGSHQIQPGKAAFTQGALSVSGCRVVTANTLSVRNLPGGQDIRAVLDKGNRVYTDRQSGAWSHVTWSSKYGSDPNKQGWVLSQYLAYTWWCY